MSLLIKQVQLNGNTKDILIEGNSISKIADSLPASADMILDGRNKAILPAFYNTHTHAAMSLMRGFADDLPLFTWLNDYIWPTEENITDEDIYIGTKFACLEMIKSGTVYFNDMYWSPDVTAKAVDEMGMRADIACTILATINQPLSRDQIESKWMTLQENNQTGDRIRFILGPHAIYTVSKETLIDCRQIGLKHDLPLHIHLAETQKEYKDCMKAHGLSPVAYLDSIGIFDLNVIIAHGIYVDDHDLKILHDKHVHVAHCPSSNMKLASGYLPWESYKNAHILPSLGTDGASSNNSLDMLMEMKMAALGAKNVTGDPVQASSETIFKMATQAGAEFTGYNAGSIEEGKLADCLLVDLTDHRLVPNHNLISNMVYSASSECIHTVICNGNILMKDRKVKGEEELIRRAQERATQLISK